MPISSGPSVGLIGNGSWATAIAKLLCKNVDTLNWWVRDDYTKDYILKYNHNPKYISSVEFKTEHLHISSDINDIVSASDILIIAVPSIYIQDCLEKLTVSFEGKYLVSAVKGIVPGHFKILGDYLFDEFQVPKENFAVISGPCHAEEVALERLSYLTIAAEQKELAKTVAGLLSCSFLRTTLSNDVFGTEYSAVLKNIYALAAGIYHGLGYGDNFQAVLMSNAIREIERIVSQVSPAKRNINDSSYLGDLLVTGYSFFSRNRMFGNFIGKGYTVQSAILEMQMVAEGYYATKGVYELKQEFDVKKTPIISAVYKILYEDKNPAKVMKKLTYKLN